MDPEATAKVARQYPDIIVGIKTAHFTGPEWTAVDRAVAAGTAANIPVAVDFGNFNPARPFEELVTKHLRPGDWYTHMVEAAQGFAIRAAGLYGAAEALLQSIGATGQVTMTRVQDRYLSLAMEALGESAFRAAAEDGRAMSLQRILDVALLPSR